MVPATRSMTWRNDRSRSGVPSVPRKYFCATMLTAVGLQSAGNSTSGWANATVPSVALVIEASWRSHFTLSYG